MAEVNQPDRADRLRRGKTGATDARPPPGPCCPGALLWCRADQGRATVEVRAVADLRVGQSPTDPMVCGSCTHARTRSDRTPLHSSSPAQIWVFGERALCHLPSESGLGHSGRRPRHCTIWVLGVSVHSATYRVDQGWGIVAGGLATIPDADATDANDVRFPTSPAWTATRGGRISAEVGVGTVRRTPGTTVTDEAAA